MLRSLVTACMIVGFANACTQLPEPPSAVPMYTGARTPAPFGYVDFCRRHAADCESHAAAVKGLEMTPEKWAELADINNSVNREILPVTDQDLYRKVEYWTYPNGLGDCEDYVLEKRRRLIAQGWPAQALLISVAMEYSGSAHAVLVVSTRQGDFVLDNQIEEIRPWHDTPYIWDKRQSTTDPLIWVSLESATGNPDLSSASLSEQEN